MDCGYKPVSCETFGTLALSSFRVTFTPVVAEALLGAVFPEPPLWTRLRADRTLRGRQRWFLRQMLSLRGSHGEQKR